MKQLFSTVSYKTKRGRRARADRRPGGFGGGG